MAFMNYMKVVNSMPNKFVDPKRKYLLNAYIGTGTGIIHEIKKRFWSWMVAGMSEGEILDRYYEMTDKGGDIE